MTIEQRSIVICILEDWMSQHNEEAYFVELTAVEEAIEILDGTDTE